MRTHRYLIIAGLFATPLVELAACSSDTSPPDGGPDAAKDVTLDTAHSDVVNDVGVDVAHDAASDASDASDAADVIIEAGSSWHTPTCDGVITTGEYGTSANQTVSGAQTWYMTWDATNLYIALDNANLTEANVIYVGFSGKGLTTTQTYDSTGGTLPFPADGVVYAKSTYQESRTANADAGTWVPSTGVMFCGGVDGGVDTREEVIPWTALGATAIPASFRFLAYATSSGGFIYAEIPTTNPSADAGTSAVFAHDFFVASTANGTGSFPFATTE